MRNLRGEELWAAKMIETSIGAPVRQHDDGSRPGMHDLDILLSDERTGAVEVTAAGDQDAIEQWNVMYGSGRWIVESIQGGWMVEVRIRSSWKRLKEKLPALLAQLETAGIRSLRGEKGSSSPFSRVAGALGIENAHQGATAFPGSVYMTLAMPLDRAGGIVPDTGDALAIWVSAFLREPKQADVIRKLAVSKGEERHAFVFLPGFNTAPFVVNDLLWRRDATMPATAPDLPEPLTHVWAVSTWTCGMGFRWDPIFGWLTFGKGLDDQGVAAVDGRQRQSS
jgi:hypothetical protein